MWSNGVGKREMDLFLCISMTNDVKSCKKFDEKAQTAIFTAFVMLSQSKVKFRGKNGKKM